MRMVNRAASEPGVGTVAAAVHHRRAAALESLTREFNAQLLRGWHSAAQLVLVHRSEVLLELCGGVSPSGGVTPETPFLVFSIAKTLLALCIHHLADRQVIALDEPVCRYWPEFAGGGKDACTVRHVLLHQTGLASRGLWRQLQPFQTWDRTRAWLERSRPSHQPGTTSAYQPLNYGFILGEVLRRAAGLSPQEYLHQCFLGPMGLTVTTWSPSSGEIAASPRIESPDPFSSWLFNRRYLRARMVPGFNLLSTARELAALFVLLNQGGSYRGVRYLSPQTVSEATALRFRGVDRTIRRETLWAMGFHLGGFKREHAWRPGPAMGALSSPRTYGHCGHLSSIAWADPDADLVFAFTCNGLLSSRGAASRWQRLADLAWASVE